MALTERERQTQERYDVSADEWLEHSGGRDRPSFWAGEMKEFALQLGEGRKVLEIGCGPATDGKYLIQKGLECVSTDFAYGMLTLARELNTNNTLLQMDMQNLAFPDNSFNGFWATACLLHLEDPDKTLKELVRVTNKGGIGFITIKEGDREVVDPRTGYFFRYYHHPKFIRKLGRVGLETIRSGRRAGTPGHDYLTYLVSVNK